jgi:Meiotically up-regulated gene 113
MVAVDAREANVRAGYVYVISNIGVFGDQVVKIGMTRRLEPMDRVNELGDASVPFRFDVHALIFSDDAVGLERKLHREFEANRVNHVNLRREFFSVAPTDVRDALSRLDGQHLLEFHEEAEALEWRTSQKALATPEHSDLKVATPQ